LVISDYFESAIVQTSISTAFTLMDFNASGRGMAIGKVSEGNKFEVAWPAEFLNTVMIREVPVATKPIRIYSGARVTIPQTLDYTQAVQIPLSQTPTWLIAVTIGSENDRRDDKMFFITPSSSVGRIYTNEGNISYRIVDDILHLHSSISGMKLSSVWDVGSTLFD
jgi:hypothetical protein